MANLVELGTGFCVSTGTKALVDTILKLYPGPYLFFPYQSPDCVALHVGICRRIIINGCKAKVMPPFEKFDVAKYFEPVSERSDGLLLERLQSSLREGCLLHNIKNLYYPILDTLIREIPFELIIKDCVVKQSLFHDVLKRRAYFEQICLQYNCCFIADSAYLDNQILKQVFMVKGGRVLFLNPMGKIAEFVDIYASEFSISNMDYYEYIGSSDLIENYIRRRFSGLSNRDMDSARSFAPNYNSSCECRKVLFLHAFRDANNTTWNYNQPFDSYLEWADYTLGLISKRNDFHNWYIKQHPSSIYYENDDEIFLYLRSKHNVPSDCILKCPSTKDILMHQMPIYTNNGSIVLEAAIHGYKAYHCGSRFDADIGIRAIDKDSWAEFLMMMPYDSIDLRIDHESQLAAKLHLWKAFEWLNIDGISPNRAVLPRENPLSILFLTLTQAKNSLVRPPRVSSIPKIGE